MSDFVFLNGNIIPKSETKISIDDRGFHFGDGLYDIMLVHKGKIIDFDDHYARFQDTANRIYIKLGYTKEQILNYSQEIIAKNNVTTGRLMIILSRGESDRWLSDFSTIKQNFAISAHNYDCKIGQNNLQFIKLKSYSDIRWKIRDIKITSLLPSVITRYEAIQEGFDDVLYYNENNKNIEETSRGNVFIVKGNSIITPPLSENLLPGITRMRILKLMKSNNNITNCELIEKDFTMNDIYDADEIFVTSSTTRVVGVSKIDHITRNNFTITKKVLEMYDNSL